ncbi:hypothetical protein AA313_de0208305 [Arthrobotrys entomopaga]|nr:hypothetical protein AA313_de0208305 [Arthrobotrys entomopaga]
MSLTILDFPSEILSDILTYASLIRTHNFKFERALRIALTCRRFYAILLPQLYSHCSLHICDFYAKEDKERDVFYFKLNRFPGNTVAEFGSAKKKLGLYSTHGQFVSKDYIPGLIPRSRRRNHPPLNLDYLKSTPDQPVDTIIRNLTLNFPNLTTARLEFALGFSELKVIPILYNLITKCVTLKRLNLTLHVDYKTEYPTLETLLSTLTPSHEYASLESLNLELRLKPQRTSRKLPPPPELLFLITLVELFPQTTFERVKDFSFYFYVYNRFTISTYATDPLKRFLHFPNLRKLTIHVNAPTRKLLDVYCKFPKEGITQLITMDTCDASNEDLTTFLLTFPNIHTLTIHQADRRNKFDPARNWCFLNDIQPPHLRRLKYIEGWTKSSVARMKRKVGTEFWKKWRVKYLENMDSMRHGPLWKFRITF